VQQIQPTNPKTKMTPLLQLIGGGDSISVAQNALAVVSNLVVKTDPCGLYLGNGVVKILLTGTYEARATVMCSTADDGDNGAVLYRNDNTDPLGEIGSGRTRPTGTVRFHALKDQTIFVGFRTTTAAGATIFGDPLGGLTLDLISVG
jgi:hypothetical protein